MTRLYFTVKHIYWIAFCQSSLADSYLPLHSTQTQNHLGVPFKETGYAISYKN